MATTEACSAVREATAIGSLGIAVKKGALLLQLEKALSQQRRPSTVVYKKLIKKIIIKKEPHGNYKH